MLEVHLFMDDTALTNFSLVHGHLFMGDGVIPNNISFDCSAMNDEILISLTKEKINFSSKMGWGVLIYE